MFGNELESELVVQSANDLNPSLSLSTGTSEVLGSVRLTALGRNWAGMAELVGGHRLENVAGFLDQFGKRTLGRTP